MQQTCNRKRGALMALAVLVTGLAGCESDPPTAIEPSPSPVALSTPTPTPPATQDPNATPASCPPLTRWSSGIHNITDENTKPVPWILVGGHVVIDSTPLFNNRPVPLFSDLLLHDVGTGDHIPQASALPNEIRTPSLWGLRARRPYLHDGRAGTLLEAVLMHGGEATSSRERVEQLTPAERGNLLAFLASL